MRGNKACIIGVSPDGAASLTTSMRRQLEKADIICGGHRLLDLFPSLTGEKIAIGNNLDKIADLIKKIKGQKQVVVLASGDPGFFGIAAYLIDVLGKNSIKIIPNVSAMQIAFARIGESWDDATFVSVHGRPIEHIIAAVRNNVKIVIFTDGENTPAAIARVLLNSGISGYRAYICENLGNKNERITKTRLKGLCKKEFSPLNTLILIRDKSKLPDHSISSIIGIPDSEFFKRHPKSGLITKQEIRAISLAKMQIAENSIVWDIGAGSGALSIEASRLATKGHVYAIEKNNLSIITINKNIRKFKAVNIDIVHAIAPEGLDKLVAPSTVFIGGSGGRMEKIIEYIATMLISSGRIVINLIGLENLNLALSSLENACFNTEITLASIARSTTTQEVTRLAALNPVFIVTASRGKI